MADRSRQSEIVFKKVLIQKGLSIESNEESDYSEGDFSLDEPASGDNVVDLLAENNALTSIVINEDMFAPSLSGSITFNDVSDFSSKLPIKGNELLWIEIEEPGGEIKAFPPFHIYSVEEITSDSVTAKGFTCHFISRDISVATYNETHLYADGEDRLREDFENEADQTGGFGTDPFGEDNFGGGFGEPNFDPANQPMAGGFGGGVFGEDSAMTIEVEGGMGDTTDELDVPDPDEIDRDPEFYGYIDEFIVSLLAQNPEFDQGSEEPLIERVEQTTNKIWYRPQEGDWAETAYPSIKRDGPKKFLTLINQLAENAYDSDRKAANYVFYQDLYKWNFKSIDTMITEGEDVPEEKVFKLTQEISDPSQAGESIRGSILSVNRTQRADFLTQLKAGAYISNISYYKPKVDINKYPVWYSLDLKRHYYKVNCSMRMSFPAAIVGFEQIHHGIAQWRYAFAEVYLVFDYERRVPSFKIKPIEKGGVRSWIGYEGPTGASGPYWIYKNDPDGAQWESTVDQSSNFVPGPFGGDFGSNADPPEFDYFARPAFNTMEMGNDGYFNSNDKVGWEAPGIRLDSQLWEEGCFKIQPIRGSMGLGPDVPGAQTALEDETLNNVKDLNPDRGTGIIPNVQDDAEVHGIYPVVSMNIYFDQEGQAHYFFTASNATDGTCDEVDAQDCKDERDDIDEEVTVWNSGGPGDNSGGPGDVDPWDADGDGIPDFDAGDFLIG